MIFRAMRAMLALGLCLGLAPGCAQLHIRTTPPPTAEVSTVVAPDGGVYRVWEDTSGDLFDDEADVPRARPGLTAASTSPDVYQGTCRKKAKLSFPSSAPVEFADIGAFLASVPDDTTMKAKSIPKDATSERVTEENKNVTFPAWIVASNKPADQDYHVIIGNDPTSPTVAINVEVSGLPVLPADSSFSTQAQADVLTAARNAYKLGMGDRLPSGNYKHYDPGIPVRITGAAFYDSCHSPGQVGPAKWRPILKTCWEVHPVTAITFTSAVTPGDDRPWSNEIHYDDFGTDQNELVEIAGPSGTSLEGWKLVLYNGSNRKPYKTVELSGTISEIANGLGVASFDIKAIQNGSPDGIALVDDSDEVVQFLSYEGQLLALSGAAAGTMSTDIGKAESNANSASTSLQLIGSGNTYADFEWSQGRPATPGSINDGQTFD